jgi:hypothetical protein
LSRSLLTISFVLCEFHGARQVVSAQVDIYQDIDLQTLVWLGKGTEALAHARMRTQLKKVSGFTLNHQIWYWSVISQPMTL